MRGLLPGPQLLPRWPAAALPTLLHNPPPHWVCQLLPCHESSPTSCLSLPFLPIWMKGFSLIPWLSECFFFNSLVVRLPHSLIFCQFWLFFVFKFVVVLLLVVQGGIVCLPMLLSWPEVSMYLLHIDVSLSLYPSLSLSPFPLSKSK